MNFNEYLLLREYDEHLHIITNLLLRNQIRVECIEELTNLYSEATILEFNPLKIGASMLGGATGAALGGPVGVSMGATAGGWLADKFKNMFKSQQASQIDPAFQQAKQAVHNLVQSISKVNLPPGSDAEQLKSLNGQAQKVIQVLQDLEPNVKTIDADIQQKYIANAKQQGGIAQKMQGVQGNGLIGKTSRWLGNKLSNIDAFNQQGGIRRAIANTGDKMQAWAEKNPKLAQLATLGTTTALAGGLYGAGGMLKNMMGGSGQHDVSGQHNSGQQDSSDNSSDHEQEQKPSRFQRIFHNRNRSSEGWNVANTARGFGHQGDLNINGDGVPDNPQSNYFNRSNNTYYGADGKPHWNMSNDGNSATRIRLPNGKLVSDVFK